MTEAVRLAYAQGFMDKCAEAGLDAEKAAQDALRDAAGGALSGAAVGGAAVGGAHAYDALMRKSLGLSNNAASVAHWFSNELPGLTKNMSRDDQLMLKLWKATRAIKGRPKAVIGGLAGLGALSHMATGGGRGTKAAQFSLGADSNRNSALGTAGAAALGTVPGTALAGLGKYQMHKATVPGFITGETGTRAGRIVMDAAKHSRGKGKLIAGLIAALVGGGAAAGANAYRQRG